MTRKDFNALADDLVARGYRKYPSIREADYAYYKSFGKSECEECRSNYQICFDAYDFGKYADREPFFEKEPWSVAPMILISREVNERVDLNLSSATLMDKGIDYIEQLGESFYNWVEQNIEIENETKI
jgi:hypothetical protein